MDAFGKGIQSWRLAEPDRHFLVRLVVRQVMNFGRRLDGFEQLWSENTANIGPLSPQPPLDVDPYPPAGQLLEDAESLVDHIFAELTVSRIL